MNLFRAIHKTQVIRPQNPYFSNLSCGVCLQNTYDFSPFGVSLDGRTVEGDFYRRGFNGMEKDNEIKGNGNSYNTEFRLLDPRTGRWLSIDPIVKVWQAPYIIMGNSPITHIDPKGDDEYYNYKGQYLGSDDAKTSTPRLVKQSDWDTAMKAIPKDDNPFNNHVPSSNILVRKSKEIKFQSVEDQQKIMRILETKTVTDKKEAAGIITLNIETATISVEEDLTAARFPRKVEWMSTNKQDDPFTIYVNNGKFNKIIIGFLHSHPQDGTENEYHGPSTPDNTSHPGSSDTQTAQKRKMDSYVLDEGLYRATPSGETEKLDNKTDIGKSALETYGANHPAPIKQ
jgi:RHS repeat-associated protein